MVKDTMTPVVSLDAVDTMTSGHGDTFAAQLAPIGKTLGLEKLGTMLTVVPPGKRAFPFHVHHANDELFVILAGQGEYRYGDATYPVKAGDVCAAPAADEAHQLINTGKTELRYLSVSTKLDPEVVEYPDSGKFAAISYGRGNSFANARLRYVGREDTSLDYWDGEGDG